MTDYSQFVEQSKQIRRDRSVSILLLSGVSGPDTNQFLEERSSSNELWITASGVYTQLTRRDNFYGGMQGGHTQDTWAFSFNYEEVKGYENSKAIQYAGRRFNIVEKNIGYWGRYITHIDFIVIEGS